ncbi:hypothetical protein [Sandaracinus amylolyticus]|uniref:hypothetical protein n=1 Tax=Sandaracinus amylolyticus TaxID=927083 RepID=UPI001F4776C5|nr:hypothetical protein [Sandaracinus amylolyticus]UJR78981.1 Hypothetical protein I5071_10140 [Sandaracinus amylolyticus]
MSLLRRLFGGFGERPPAPPLLLRVRAGSGAIPEQVELVITWASGRRDQRSVFAAQGLCIVPWRVGENAVQIGVRALGGRGALRVSARENASGSVHEVRLADELAAE